jgi:RNA polymerase sigma-70 factor (ECF subfamily)
LFAVALNLVRDDGRRTVRQGRRLQLLKGETENTADSPAEDYDKNEKARIVRVALAQLRDLDREVLLLKAEGFDYDEISAATGLNKSAIGTTLSRARKRLVEAYRAEEKDRHVAS